MLIFIAAAAKLNPSEPPQQSTPPPPQPAAPPAEASAASSGPPPPPKTIMEALEQRLAKYQEASDKAKEEGNSGKVRRMGRIVKVSEIIKNFSQQNLFSFRITKPIFLLLYSYKLTKLVAKLFNDLII